MERKANFELVEHDNRRVLIRDVGPWDRYLTVTNAAEQVVAELAPMLNGRRLEYIDSLGDTAVILIKDGQFAGFDPR